MNLLQDEISKLAGQIQFLKIVGMMSDNRHLKVRKDGYFSKENCAKQLNLNNLLNVRGNTVIVLLPACWWKLFSVLEWLSSIIITKISSARYGHFWIESHPWKIKTFSLKLVNQQTNKTIHLLYHLHISSFRSYHSFLTEYSFSILFLDNVWLVKFDGRSWNAFSHNKWSSNIGPSFDGSRGWAAKRSRGKLALSSQQKQARKFKTKAPLR